jgi:hypothetical protein
MLSADMQDPVVASTDGSHLVEIGWTLIACCGGIAKYLSETAKGNRPFRAGELLAKAFVSAFSGLTAGHAMLTITDNKDFVFIAVALGGWMGADFLDFLWPLLKKKWNGSGGPSAA